MDHHSGGSDFGQEAMEEQDDEVEMMSSWSAAEGTLEQSVKVVEDSEDAVYTAGPTSRLVLVPPPSSDADQPCELTVTFKRRQGHVKHIYVLSTARICEIYGQTDKNGDREYLCTVRGGIISLSDDEESEDDGSSVSPDTPEQEEEDRPRANNSPGTTSSSPSASPEFDSETEAQQQSLPFDDQEARSGTSGKMGLSYPIDGFPSLPRRDSEEDLFRSFTEAINGRVVDGSIVFEESLDHADWVECPHSPMKSASSAQSDDETEVDITKSGFYFIDADVEAQQQSDQPRVRLFTDEIRASGKNSTSLPLERSDAGSSGNSSWQEAIEESTLEKDATDPTSPDGSTSERHSEEAHKIEETYESPRAQVEEFANGDVGENLPGSGFCVFEVNEERDSSSSAPGKAIAETAIVSTEEAEVSSSEIAVQEEDDLDMESRFPVEGPVYECEVNVVNADAWTSVTIRLLSIKSKSQVEIHRVVATYTPGPPIQANPVTTNGASPFQQGAGNSSFLAMLVPGILQMARGMSEQRTARNAAISSAAKLLGGSDGVTNVEVARSLPSVEDISPNLVKRITGSVSSTVEKDLNGDAQEELSSHSGGAQGGIKEPSSFGSNAQQNVPQHGLQVVKGEGSKELEETRAVHKETGLLEAHQKEDNNRVDELVQRLGRLETICLRMESSLNVALESMDKRLKLLESGGLGRMPPALGHSVWGPGFDSGSFVSATSVYVPAAQTGPETPSLMDSQIPFTISSPPVDTPLGESSPKGVPSTEATAFSGAVPSTSPPPPLSTAPPSWPLPSWPQNASPDSSSHSSGLTVSYISKNDLVDRSNGSLHDSEHLSNGGETYWESRTSDESESDISSDSEQTSYADNCEDPACGCCPESQSSSPTKPAQLVDNALASALSAFSASFEAQHNKDFGKEDECYHAEEEEEESDEEDSFTSEEQVPLVELDSFPCYYEKEAVVNVDADAAFLHGYEAIPLSSEKDTGDLSIGEVIMEKNFWSSEMDEHQPIDWQDEGLQTQEEKIFRVLGDYLHSKEEGAPTFDSSSAIFIQVPGEQSLAEGLVDGSFAPDFASVLQKSAVEGEDVGAVLEPSHVLDVQQNSNLQALFAGADANFLGADGSTWLPQDWTGEQTEIAKNILSSYLSVRDLSHEELFLQEGLFPDEWNWFTPGFSPFSSLVEVTDLSEDAPADKGPVLVEMETMSVPDGNPSKVVPSHTEPWSLLDNDVPVPSSAEQFAPDLYGQDWIIQQSPWSLLDEYPTDVKNGEKHSEVVVQGDSHGNKQPRSLLDEDVISLQSGTVPDLKQEKNPVSPHAFLEDHQNLNMSQSPPSEASRSNPFEDEYIENSDFSQGSYNPPLVVLEEPGEEVHDLESHESEGTQSLLFHLSL